MPRLADSRIIGLFPLQHYFDSTWDLDFRASLFAVRITDRRDKPGSQNQLGHWETKDQSLVGDIHGGQLIERDGNKRAVSMWRFASPLVLQKKKTSDVATPSKSAGAT